MYQHLRRPRPDQERAALGPCPLYPNRPGCVWPSCGCPPQSPAHENPPAYDDARDAASLAAQRELVWRLMVDGQWRTLAEISYGVRIAEASASARLRDFRKERYGGHSVDRRSRVGRLYEYRLRPRGTDAADNVAGL